MQAGNVLPETVDQEIFKEGYPRIYEKDFAAGNFYPFYIQTYIERDVRLIKNIGDLSTFICFINQKTDQQYSTSKSYKISSKLYNGNQHVPVYLCAYSL